MSVKHALGRGLEFGRSLLQLGIVKPAGRIAGKFRGERLRGSQPGRVVQPRTFLPARYRYYRMTLSGLAAQLQSAGFRRVIGGGSARNRAVFMAFGVGLALIDQQLDEDRRSAATCQEIQEVFTKRKGFQSPVKRFSFGHKLEDYVIGKQIGIGCNAAVYEAAAPSAAMGLNSSCSLVELKRTEEESGIGAPLKPSGLHIYPLAVKMMWNIGAGSSSEAILTSMAQELVPANPQALRKDKALVLKGHFGEPPKRVTAHPNVIQVYRAFTAEVPLLPDALDEYPAALPSRLNPDGLGNNHTLFLVMKNYPCTLKQYLSKVYVPELRHGCMMLLQLLEGVDHLCKQGVAHRDLKSDNILLEFDSAGCPRLIISDFGCCLAEERLGLRLPFTSRYVNRGGNSCLMPPEVTTAEPGPGVAIDYSKADAWAVGAIGYEIFGRPNPFYGSAGLESRSYHERQLPPVGPDVPSDVQLVVRLLLRRNPKKRPSARVAANVLHLSLWGGRALTSLNHASMGKMAEWLLCHSAAVLLKSSNASVEDELQRGFLANLDLEELRAAAGYLVYGR